jgi:hypothetical protein
MNRIAKTRCIGALRTNAKTNAAATTPRIRIGKSGFVDACLNDLQTALARSPIAKGA